MKSARSETLKRDINLVTRGLRNGTKVLFHWVSQAGDKEKIKRRTVIVVSVPAALFVVGTEYPGPVLAVGLLALLGASLWFAHVEEQEIFIDSVDFLGPFEVSGRVMDFSELLAHVAHKNPKESLEGLGLLLHQDFGSPLLTGPQIAYQLRRTGTPHPALKTPKVPPAPAVSKEKSESVENSSEQHSSEVEVLEAKEVVEDSSIEEARENPQFTETAPSPSPEADAPENNTEEAGQEDNAGSVVMEKVRGRVQGMLG